MLCLGFLITSLGGIGAYMVDSRQNILYSFAPLYLFNWHVISERVLGGARGLNREQKSKPISGKVSLF